MAKKAENKDTKEVKELESIASFFKNRAETNVRNFFLNTGTSVDLATGFGIQGVGGKFYLNGGISGIHSIAGKPQTYKSSIMLSCLGRALNIYEQAHGIVHDTEFTIPGIKRLQEVSGDVPLFDESRAMLTNQIEYDMTEFGKLISDLALKIEKEKNMLETPFINPKTNKKYLSYCPTIVAIDSWTKLGSKAEIELIENEGVDGSKTNTMYMTNANSKTKLLSLLSFLGAKFGIYFMLTSHIGKTINMNTFIPVSKDMQFMKQGESVKSAGSQFYFLSSNYMETINAAVMQDGDKKCQYPNDYSTDVELQRIRTAIIKCKHNSSGGVLNHVSSQHFGLQPTIEWYELLKDQKDFGLIGNQVHKANMLLPDVSFSRKTLRDKADSDYEFKRAMEIMGQFLFIRLYWAVHKKVKEIPPEEFVKILSSRKDMSLKDILNTRGYWTFNETKHDRKFLNILDMISWI